VVFAGQDQPAHATAGCGLDDLIRVKGGRGKQGRDFVSETPLLIGERIHGKVEEPIELHPVPSQLAL